MGVVASRPDPSRAAPRRLLSLRSDAVLADRFAAGDDAAFTVLYQRHSTSVLAVCMGVLSSRQDAEDAAQETFASLAKSLPHARPDNLAAWLTRVARNAAVDIARRRSSNAQADDDLPDRPGGDSGVKDELDSVIAGLKELPESQRTALLMRELAGHSYREIATLLETDEEAVRGLIARARVGLRAHREATEMECATARAALAAELDAPGRADKAVRRHVRACSSCRAYRRALRGDARALRGIVPAQTGPLAGSAIFGGLAAKGALLGGALTQVTAACAVSVCAVGGIVLLAPAKADHHHAAPRAAHVAPADRHGYAGASLSRVGRPASAGLGAAGQAARGGSASPVASRPAGAHPARSAPAKAGSSGLVLSIPSPGRVKPAAGSPSGGSSRPSQSPGAGTSGRSPEPTAHPASYSPGPQAPVTGQPGRTGGPGTGSGPTSGGWPDRYGEDTSAPDRPSAWDPSRFTQRALRAPLSWLMLLAHLHAAPGSGR